MMNYRQVVIIIVIAVARKEELVAVDIFVEEGVRI